MTEMVNPYIAGAPVTEARMFFGREDVFEWIQNSLTGRYADHILVIHGQRRVGKTSVLKQLGNHLPEKYIPVFFDLQGRTHTTIDRFLWWLAREIVRVLKQDRAITIPPPERELFTSDLEFFEHGFLPDLRTAIGNHVLLLTFDEFDNLEESDVKEELARPLIDYLRRLMGEEGLNFIFSIGSSGRKLENMQASYTEFFKTALYKKISFLSREQTRKLITRPVEGFLEYEDEAVERIYRLASGHPYFTQLTCHELFSLCQHSGQLTIREQDVEAVLDDVVERGTVNLKFTWDEAADIEKWALASLAHSSEPMDNTALAAFLHKQHVRFSEPDLVAAVLHLREKDILTEGNQFVIQLLQLWLQKNRPLEQVREELTEINPIANRYIEIGLEFRDAHQYDKAIENFRQALDVAPEHIQAQVNIAQTYLAQKALDQAVVEFEKALAIDDEEVAARAGLCGAYLALGDAAREKGKIKDAILAYQKVLDINAEHTEARQRMAEINRQRAEKALTDGRDEEALAAFSEALKFSPEDEELARRYEQAKVEKRTKVVTSLLAKAEKEQSARNWDGALSILRDALEIDPQNETAQKRLEMVREEQRKAGLAAILARADRAQQAGRWGLVIAALEEYLAQEPAEVRIQARLEEARQKLAEAQAGEARVRAVSLTRQERFEEALAAWEEYRRLNPSDEQAVQANIEKIQRAQTLAKNYAEAQAAFVKKNYDRAIALFKEIVVQDENYRDASRRMAEAIELRRTARKWWQNKWLWGSLSLFTLAAAAWFLFRPGSPLMAMLVPMAPTQPMEYQTPLPTRQAVTPRPAATITPTALPTATAAPPPYRWMRVNSGQFLPRDTITAIVLDPIDSGVIYVGTQNAGIYKSIDGGLSWQPIHNGLGRAWIHSLVIDPNHPQVLYAGVALGGVYKTNDGGVSWQAANTGIEADGMWEMVSVLAMDPQDSQHLYYTPSNGVYESTNGGDSWSQVQASPCPSQILGLVVQSGNERRLFASAWAAGQCAGGIYRSEDGGATWTLTGLDGVHISLGSRLWIDSQTGQYLYARGDEGWYVSSDGGQTWNTLNQECNCLAIDPKDNQTVYCGTGLIMKTTNGGQSWQPIVFSSAEMIRGITTLGLNGEDIFAGGQGLALLRHGNTSWEERSTGLGTTRVDLSLNPWDGITPYAKTTSDIFRSNTSGRTWEAFYGGAADLAFDADGSTLYLYDIQGLILRSHDQGNTWQTVPIEAKPYEIAANTKMPGMLYLASTEESPVGLYRSMDGGDHWQAIENFDKGNVVHPILYVDPVQGKSIYAVGDWSVSRSNDAGLSWEPCGDVGGWLAHTSPSALAIDPRAENHVYLATQGRGVLVSHDGCRSWQTSVSGLSSLFVNSLAIDPNSHDTIYAGTDGGAYVSFDGGKSWGQINDGLLGATVVYSIVVDKDSTVYAATPYGIFKLEKK